MKPAYPPPEDVADFSRANPRFTLIPVAIVEHRENDYPRIVRQVDVGEFPHGTNLYIMKEKLMADSPKVVRAKVRCNARTGNTVDFTTVYEPDEKKNDENARFTKATPWGDIRLGIDNPAAIDMFEVNKEYYVDFMPAS